MFHALNSRVLRNGVAGIAMVAATSWSGIALAQDAEAQAEEGGIQEIVVTAQFQSQSIQETPLAITAARCPRSATSIRGASRISSRSSSAITSS